MRMMVGRVVLAEPHPRADRIRIARVDLGDGALRQIVYGGSRVLCPGDLVPVAPPGSKLPSGIKMRQRNYRGIPSYGMLCSFQEMSGVPVNGPDEVHVLPSGLRPGQPIEDVLAVTSSSALVRATANPAIRRTANGPSDVH